MERGSHPLRDAPRLPSLLQRRPLLNRSEGRAAHAILRLSPGASHFRSRHGSDREAGDGPNPADRVRGHHSASLVRGVEHE